MTLTEKTRNLIWSALVFILAGLVCLGYILYKRDFAKYHLAFSFLNFPVFVGEMLLFFCAAVLVAWWIRRRPAFRPWHFFVGLYLAWLAVKTVTGYGAWGPLAFRHAALFYYPLFFLVGYIFFNKGLFTRWSVPVLLSAIIILFLQRHYDRYWTFTLAALGFVLVSAVKDKKIRVVMLGVLMVSIQYIGLIKTARMMFVANMVSLAFLGACIWYMWNVKAVVKLSVVLVLTMLLGFGFYKFFILGESGRVFVSPSAVKYAFRQMDLEIQHKKNYYRRIPLPVALYHSPNDQSRSYHYYNHETSLHQPDAVSFKYDDSEEVWQDYSSTFVPERNLEQDVPFFQWVPGWEQSTISAEPPLQVQDVHESVAVAEPVIEMPTGVEQVSLNNIIFRLFIWRDMLEDWKADNSPLFGVDFGRPLRSVSLEILQWAAREWGRDGWIEPHNSFFHMLYRAGVVGFGLIVLIVWALIHFVIQALRRRAWPMILLAAVMINWLVAANFLLILELPYTAIPFWLIAGMAWAYAYGNDSELETKNKL